MEWGMAMILIGVEMMRSGCRELPPERPLAATHL